MKKYFACKTPMCADSGAADTIETGLKLKIRKSRIATDN